MAKYPKVPTKNSQPKGKGRGKTPSRKDLEKE